MCWATTVQWGLTAYFISTINDCSGSAFGGALGLLGFDESVFAVDIDDCTFTNNTANNNGRGAACYIQGNNTPITLTNSVLSGNLSQGGTFVNNSDGALTVRNTRFLDNGNTSAAGRGALVAYMTTGQPILIDSCYFEKPAGSREGQALQPAGGEAVAIRTRPTKVFQKPRSPISGGSAASFLYDARNLPSHLRPRPKKPSRLRRNKKCA